MEGITVVAEMVALDDVHEASAEADAELAAANAAVDKAVQDFRDMRKLVYKLAVEAFYDRRKASYCFTGMNAEIVRLHMPKWDDHYTDATGRRRTYSGHVDEYGTGKAWEMPADAYDGHSTEKKMVALETEDRSYYTALGLLDLARRIDAAREAWMVDVKKTVEEKCSQYYTTDYMARVRKEVGLPPVRAVHNGELQFGWRGERPVDNDVLLRILDKHIQAALTEYDETAQMQTYETYRNGTRDHSVYVPTLRIARG
jgi:hypothetical protein